MKTDVVKLSGNMEDYLETIHALAGEKGVARVGEIAKKLEVKSPSVNAALRGLSERNLVRHEKYGYVTLTKEGRTLAAVVQEKHDILFRFLTEFLMLAPAVAEKEACSIEHAISQETFIRLVKFFRFLRVDPNGEKPKMLRDFARYLKTGTKVVCASKRADR